MPQLKRIEIYSSDDPCLPEQADKFIEFWQEKIDSVPEEFRATTQIEVEASEQWGSPCLNVTVSYTREETGEEATKRNNMEKANLERRDQGDRAEYEKLKAKFESDA